MSTTSKLGKREQQWNCGLMSVDHWHRFNIKEGATDEHIPPSIFFDANPLITLQLANNRPHDAPLTILRQVVLKWVIVVRQGKNVRINLQKNISNLCAEKIQIVTRKAPYKPHIETDLSTFSASRHVVLKSTMTVCARMREGLYNIASGDRLLRMLSECYRVMEEHTVILMTACTRNLRIGRSI